MPLKLFFVDPMSYNNLEIYDLSLLSYCSKNIETYFFCNALLSKEIVKGLHVKKIFNYSKKRGLAKVYSYLYSLYKLSKYINKIRPNIVHIQWVRIPLIDLFFYKAIRYFYNDIKLIYTAHNILPHKRGFFDTIFFKSLYNFFDYVIIHTSNSTDEIRELSNRIDISKFRVIPHGVLNYQYSKDAIAKNIANINISNLGKNKIVFSSLGAQNYYKGIDILVDVWLNTPELRNNNSIQLIIAGKGQIPQYEALLKLNNVHISNNFLSDIDFLSYLEISDVVLFPYRKISQSGLLLTVLPFNKPIIATQLGGLIDPFKIGNIGWIIKPNSTNELQKCLLNIIKNPDTIKKISTNDKLWEKVNKHFSWKDIGDKTYELYCEAVV